MALTKTQEELIGAYGAIESPKTPYWNIFTGARRPYLALSNVIRVDEVISGLSKAGIIPRGVAIPPIKINGHNTVVVQPNIIAGSIGVSALDGINVEAGEKVILNGKEISSKDYDRVRKLEELKFSVSNTTEDTASRVFITGKAKGVNGEDIDIGLVEEETKTKGTNQWLTVLNGLVSEYYSKNKKYPDKVIVGAKVADSIIKEINTSKTPSFGNKIELTDSGIVIALTGFAIPVETYPVNDIEENTDTKVTLYKNDCFVPVYAGLEYIGTTGNPELIRADVLVDKTEANREIGQAKLFAKSAPFPLIILPDLFRRYNFTDLS